MAGVWTTNYHGRQYTLTADGQLRRTEHISLPRTSTGCETAPTGIKHTPQNTN